MSSSKVSSSSLQLVYKENGDLKIDQDALDTLMKIDQSIAVCVCVGPYRQGKSFLLNKIVGDRNLFGVGHEDDPYTEGVWVYQHPGKKTKNERFTILIMDVEVIYLI